ncbi:MAG: MotA/TolQ/ExbB proton channel family protein, partial [Deltaproteobacteria bacterium]|nr:MotA/TolQ/ExbB proton channel family protein [Deltaproteobacteria bacterium]
TPGSAPAMPAAAGTGPEGTSAASNSTPGQRSMPNSGEAQQQRPDRDNLDLLKSLFLAVVSTAVFYEIFPLPFLDQGRLLALFDNQVSQVITGMSFWSLFLLLFKYLNYRRQRRALGDFSHPSVMAVFAGGLYAREAQPALDSVQRALAALKTPRFHGSVIYRRVTRLIELSRTTARKEGLNELLDYQAQLDLKRLESSYAIVHVFLWAIPILGFIGTVMGIGDAVSEFAGFIQTAEGGGQFSAQMRTALGGVTGGLAVAFNTTFLALVLVIPVMLITSFLTKLEEELLMDIEEFCLEKLLPQLHIQPGEDALAEGFEEHMHRILRLSGTWLSQFEPLVARLTRQSELMSAQLGGLQPLVKDFTDRLLPGEREPAAPAHPAQPPKPTAGQDALPGTPRPNDPSEA